MIRVHTINHLQQPQPVDFAQATTARMNDRGGLEVCTRQVEGDYEPAHLHLVRREVVAAFAPGHWVYWEVVTLPDEALTWQQYPSEQRAHILGVPWAWKRDPFYPRMPEGSPTSQPETRASPYPADPSTGTASTTGPVHDHTTLHRTGAP